MEDESRTAAAGLPEMAAETSQCQTAAAAAASKVGFLITAVDVETRVLEESASSPVSHAASSIVD
eukprot:4325773-Amphidinium_carterae.1